MRILGRFGIAVAAVLGFARSSPAMDIYIGTYTNKGSDGIYRVTLDDATGKLGTPELAAKIKNPGFLAVGRPGVLYAACDIGEFEGQKTGTVAAFRIESAGGLTLIGQKPTGAQGPCHVSIDHTGRVALLAHYGAGVVSAVRLDADGVPSGAASVVKVSGPLGPQKDRQDAPHAHSVLATPDNRRAIAADLGTDSLERFELDAKAGTIRKDGTVKTPAGDGPRHMAFSLDGRTLFVANELANSLAVYAFDAANDAIEWQSSLSTLPRPKTANDTVAEVAVHPGGRFVYVSNRGHDSIAVFSFDPSTRAIKLVQTEPTQGDHPRHFSLSPDGRWLVVANMRGNTLVSFAVDATTGMLTPTGSTAAVNSPMCVRFVTRR